MNYIFDIGNVLVDYNPKKFLANLFTDRKIADKIYNLIFLSPEWLSMDAGTLTREQASEIFCAKEPGLQTEIELTMQNINSIFTPKQDTIKLLPKIKKAGHRLYYLSNIHKEIRDYLLKEHDYFKFFDGGVFSCDVNMIKPSPGIYQHLLEKYNLSAETCIFYDDMKENAEAAQKEGINGVIFKIAECVQIFC